MIAPVVHFPGNCAEAIAFYEQIFTVTRKDVSYTQEAPPDSGIEVTADNKNQIMHSDLMFNGSLINMSDDTSIPAAGIDRLNVFFATVDEVCDAFNKLKEGGKVIVELGPQFFSRMYGSVEDRFGIMWQLIC